MGHDQCVVFLRWRGGCKRKQLILQTLVSADFWEVCSGVALTAKSRRFSQNKNNGNPIIELP